jgi:hypothetical protein
MALAAVSAARPSSFRRISSVVNPWREGRVKEAAGRADTRIVELSLSPQMRIVALVGGFAVLALAAGMFFLTRAQADAAAEDLSASELQAALQPVGSPKPAATTPAKTAPPATKAAKPAPKPRPKVDANGVPTAIVDALRRAPAAVVALTAGGAAIDRVTLAEAKAGAAAAGVPYVELDVLDAEIGRAIARTFGVLEPPVTLVYQRPTALFLKLDGYADSATIAQAAENARAAAGDR